MYKGKTVSLVFPAFNEEENIKNAIQDFKSLGVVDEIIVVDNNSNDQTAKIARAAGTQVVKEPNQGYGFALRRGLREASGDYVVLCEPDGTFDADDLERLLQYIKTYDLVTGTRTNKKFIQKDANMSMLLRAGNFLVAKITQVLFKTSSLTDCGCTFRVFSRPLLTKINPRFTVGGSYFLPETVILTALAGGKIKEVPVHYRKRIGTSKITGSLKRTFYVGFKMLELILKYRFLNYNRLT